jgi:hypothetical protein
MTHATLTGTPPSPYKGLLIDSGKPPAASVGMVGGLAGVFTSATAIRVELKAALSQLRLKSKATVRVYYSGGTVCVFEDFTVNYSNQPPRG